MKARDLKILCCAVYFFSYITRQTYSAALTEIINDLNVSKTLAGVGVMGSFVTYGVFQIISGFLGDKYRPQKVIFIGLSGSAVVNMLILVFPNIYIMNVLWCVNGAFQSLIWPPLIRIFADNFDTEEYSTLVVRATQASYAATVITYLTVPAVISSLHWKYIFALSGAVSLAFSLFWLFKTKDISADAENENYNKCKSALKNDSKINIKLLISLGVIPMVISTIIAGFIRDGISTWMPTYINEIYGISSFASILTGAVIPISCAVFLDVLKKIGEMMGNELKTASVYFGVAFVSFSVLFFNFAKYPILDVIIMSVITVCVHGVNLMIVCNIPKHFLKYNKSATMTGLFNASVYGGAAISAYATAFLSSGFGWGSVIGVWSVICLLGVGLCFFTRNRMKKLARGSEE